MTLQTKMLALKPQDAEELIYFTLKEVAELRCSCTRTVKRDVHRGRLKETRLNRRCIRYSLAAVKAYLAGQYPSMAIERSPGDTGGNDTHDSSKSASDEALQKRLLAAKTNAFARKSAETTQKGDKKPYNYVFLASCSFPPVFAPPAPLHSAVCTTLTPLDNRRRFGKLRTHFSPTFSPSHSLKYWETRSQIMHSPKSKDL